MRTARKWTYLHGCAGLFLWYNNLGKIDCDNIRGFSYEKD